MYLGFISVLSDIDQTTLESLPCSIDSLILDDDFLLSEDDIMNADFTDSVDIMKHRPRSAEPMRKADTNMKGKHDRDRLTNGKADENGNENSWSENDKKKSVSNSKQPASPTKRSRIPKSRTFDSTTSIHSTRNGHNGPNHVFMTSHECMVVPGSSKIPRQTIASRLRYEKHTGKDNQQQTFGFSDVDVYAPQDGYQTPTQRKDVLLRDMRRQVREVTTICEEKDREIDMYKQHVDEETSKVDSHSVRVSSKSELNVKLFFCQDTLYLILYL